jgi:hypothetical protein
LLGEPYRARFADDFENLLSRPVDHPEIISTYFKKSNEVDKHNQACQFELRLKKHWRTQNAWFRLVTTIIGICVTDAWKGYRHAFHLSKRDEELPVHDFADRLAYELIHNNFPKDDSSTVAKALSPLMKPPVRRSPRRHKLGVRFVPDVSDTTDVSPLTSTFTSSTKAKEAQAEALWVQVMQLHKHIQQQTTESSGCKLKRHCDFCKNKTGWYCSTCNVYCCPEMKGGKEPRYCYKQHILEVHPKFKQLDK